MTSLPSKAELQQCDTLLTAAQVAAKLNIAKTAVYAMVSRGELSHYRIGRLVRFTTTDVDTFLAERRTDGENPKTLSTLLYARYPKV